jgi:hypothetical protein
MMVASVTQYRRGFPPKVLHVAMMISLQTLMVRRRVTNTMPDPFSGVWSKDLILLSFELYRWRFADGRVDIEKVALLKAEQISDQVTGKSFA